MSSVVILDNNVWNLLVSSAGAALKADLEAAVEDRRIMIPLNYAAAVEISATSRSSPDKHKAMLAAVDALCRGTFLMPFPDRVRGETVVGHQLSHREVFFLRHESHEFFEALNDPEVAQMVAGQLDRMKTRYLSMEGKKPGRFSRRVEEHGVDKNQRKAALREIFSDPKELVTEWVNDELRRRETSLGLRKPRRASPSLSPTLWFSTSYHLGRIRLEINSQKGVDDGDLADWAHTGDAAYAHAFVTDDQTCHEVMGWAPVPNRRFIRSAELSTYLQRLPTPRSAVQAL